MFTGARLESIAALEAARAEPMGVGFVLRIVNDKSEAGTRPVAVVHPAAVAVIKQRLVGAAKDKKAEGRLFRELRQGADSKWSAAATKAFGRYRRSLDVPDGTDFSLVPPRRGGHP